MFGQVEYNLAGLVMMRTFLFFSSPDLDGIFIFVFYMLNRAVLTTPRPSRS